jgi:ectoine hydroxylase-related dioxygenase (phytanoyl-CoA dioxygenase family)
MVEISAETIASYQNDGAILLKGIFNDFVEDARQAIEENKANPSWRERTYHPDDGSSPFFQDYCVWDNFDGYRKLVTASPMAKIAANLMESKTARFFHDHILVKEPGNSNVTPWHQDQPYYLVEGMQSASFWVPLDPVPKNRSIEFVSGSHNWNKSFRPTRFDGTPLFENDSSDAVPNIDKERGNLKILSWATEPGDAIVFSFRTLHAAAANASSIRRRVISMRWVGDDARFAARPGKTSPYFPDLSYTPGSPFQGPMFPLVFKE